MLSFRQLEIFRAIMLSGSISAASKNLNIAQPTVTNTIRRLEDVLQVRLFDRSGGRLTPTRTALDIFEVVQPSLSSLEQLSATVREIASGRATRFRMGVSPSVSQALGPRALAKFAGLNPGARLRMDTLSLSQVRDYVWLAEGDCAVTIFPVSDPLIESQNIASISLVCLVPRAHPLAGHKAFQLSEIAGEDLIFFHPNTPHGRVIKYMFQIQGLQPRITIETRFAESAIGLIHEGFGIAIVDELTSKGLRDRQIAVIPITDAPTLPVLLHYHENSGDSNAIRFIRTCLLEAAEELQLGAAL
jgi:molybdate transport repressor ModE-like protein